MKFQRIFEELESGARTVVMELLGIGCQCPHCQAEFSDRVGQAFSDGKRVKCSSCKWRGTWRDGSILDRSRLSASQFLLLKILINYSDDTARIADFIGITPETVRSWRQLLKETHD